MNPAASVLVTGANGHLGRNLIPALLARGYRVRATVRDAGDPGKTAGLAGAGLELASLDVRDAGRFEELAQGVDLMFHLAATYKNYTASAAETDELLRDSMEGARAALLAAANARVPRVVFTSSVVTLPFVERGGRPTTEEDWRTDLTHPYHRAKTLAEQEAWRLARERRVDMVAVLPGAIIGPGFVRGTASTDVIESIMLGAFKRGAPNVNFPAVDIRDVVSGHLLAAESGAGGRFVVCNDTLPTLFEISRVMHLIDASVPAAPRLLPDFTFGLAPLFDRLNQLTLGSPRTVGREFVAAVKGKEWTMSNERARRELGWKQGISLEQSLADTMATFRRLRAARLGDAVAA